MKYWLRRLREGGSVTRKGKHCSVVMIQLISLQIGILPLLVGPWNLANERMLIDKDLSVKGMQRNERRIRPIKQDFARGGGGLLCTLETFGYLVGKRRRPIMAPTILYSWNVIRPGQPRTG